MPFEPIAAPNLSNAAAAQIRDLIAKDILRPGDQLPGERDMAAEMGISRASLRTGLQTLIAEGLVMARQGAGLFVSPEIGRGLIDPLLPLIESAPGAVADYLDFRAMLEGESAAQVAAGATAQERARIAAAHDRLAVAHEDGDREAEARLDTEFHMSLVETAGNIVATQVARSLHTLLQNTVRGNHALVFADAAGRAALMTQHEAINAAIQAQEAEAARAAMRAHLAHFKTLISEQEAAAARRAVAAKRENWALRRRAG